MELSRLFYSFSFFYRGLILNLQYIWSTLKLPSSFPLILE